MWQRIWIGLPDAGDRQATSRETARGLLVPVHGPVEILAGGFVDTNVVDGGFDKGCEELSTGGGLLSRVENGRVQSYLRLLALGFVLLVAFLIWSSRA